MTACVIIVKPNESAFASGASPVPFFGLRGAVFPVGYEGQGAERSSSTAAGKKAGRAREAVALPLLE